MKKASIGGFMPHVTNQMMTEEEACKEAFKKYDFPVDSKDLATKFNSGFREGVNTAIVNLQHYSMNVYLDGFAEGILFAVKKYADIVLKRDKEQSDKQ